MKLAACTALAILLPMAAIAETSLTVSDGYVRSSNPKSGAAFMAIANEGDADCRLSAAQSDAAERTELHTHLEEDGVMRMVEVEEGFAIPAGETFLLERGGDHVMLLGLHEPLTEGDVVPMSLDFGDCGTVAMELPVSNQNQHDDAEEAHGH